MVTYVKIRLNPVEEAKTLTHVGELRARSRGEAAVAAGVRAKGRSAVVVQQFGHRARCPLGTHTEWKRLYVMYSLQGRQVLE
jgi:hypothetical protein